MDAVAAFLAIREAATSASVQAISYNANEGAWAPTETDVFTDRATLVPSAPDVAVYGASALIAWEAGGDLYTVERASNRTYGSAIRRNRVAAAVIAGSVQVAATPSGSGILVWTEADGPNPARVGAQSFRGVR